MILQYYSKRQKHFDSKLEHGSNGISTAQWTKKHLKKRAPGRLFLAELLGIESLIVSLYADGKIKQRPQIVCLTSNYSKRGKYAQLRITCLSYLSEILKANKG